MTRLLSLSVGLCIIILASRQSVSAPANPRRPGSSGSAAIHGRATDCFEGKQVPVVSDILVFALTMKESAKIRDIINKIEQYEATHPLGYNDLPGTPFDDQFSMEVKSLHRHSKKTQTDREGGYRFANLRVGGKYFLLVVAPEAENELYYRYQLTLE